ncbi:MAG: phosphohistidine phosphatase SixA [Candidatus Zixiibacteriota bacterium]|jgi:phosphohistidine phosphatase
MNVYLVQHGQSVSKEENPERPLTEQGVIDTRNVAALIAKHTTLKIHRIVHSGKARARQTGEVLSEWFHPSEGVTMGDGLNPNDDVSLWQTRLDEETDDIMLVGHLPHLSKLASTLLCGDADKPIVAFQNSGVVCLRRNDNGSWSLAWMVIPDIIDPTLTI